MANQVEWNIVNRSLRSIFAVLLLSAAAFPALLAPRTATARANGPLDNVMPLDQVRPGMRGEVFTIIQGDTIEKLDLEVIGILPNLLGPKQDIILVKLVGERAAEVGGVAAGMSGSPVYIDGKLVGALSLKFGIFTKEALGGVTPIAQMLEADGPDTPAEPQRAGAGTAPETAIEPATGWQTGSPASIAAWNSGALSTSVDFPNGAPQEAAALRHYALADGALPQAGLPSGAYLSPIE